MGARDTILRDLVELLSVADAAVTQASSIVRTQAPGVITAKGDRDMVSEVDLTVERAVRSFLAERTPEIGFLGEEESEVDGSSDLLWVLDPVDGTANFVRQLPLCAVSLGLVSEDTSVLGVIDMPFLGTRYTAAKGLGARCNDQPISGSRCNRLEDAIVAIGDYAVGAGAAAKNATRLAFTHALVPNIQRVRMFGTAATDLAWVAGGNLDASAIFSNNPWDTSAGVLIAREAGVSVLDIDGSQHTIHSTGTVAVAKPLADDLLALIDEAQRNAQTETPNR